MCIVPHIKTYQHNTTILEHTLHTIYTHIFTSGFTNDHIGHIIADIITNSYHITHNTDTPTRVLNTSLQHQQPSFQYDTGCPAQYATRHHVQQKNVLTSNHLPIITIITTKQNININNTDKHLTTHHHTPTYIHIT